MNKWLLIFFSLLFMSCEKERENQNLFFQLDIPNGFPDPVIPIDNHLTYERIKLGKRLFYDPILSKDVQFLANHVTNKNSHLQIM